MINIPVVAAIDAGGSSFKCGLVRSDGSVVRAFQVPTVSPEETFAACARRFKEICTELQVRPLGLGIASFGPVDIDPTSPTYGVITGAAKPNWQGAAIASALGRALALPVVLDTDVNAALVAEQRWGAAQGIDRLAYITVGTGIGVGISTGDALLGRPAHPEFGHIRVSRHPQDLSYPGGCVVHGDCLEGLASAPAVAARWGDPAALPTNHPAWEIEAYYLGQACLNLFLTTRVERIVIGGGLLKAQPLMSGTIAVFDSLMAGYLPVSGKDLIRPAGLGQLSGMLGGAVLALTAFN